MRQSKLWQQNIGSKNQLDIFELKYSQSQENLIATQKRYNQLRHELEANYLLTKNKLKQVQSVSSDYSIKSKFDGRVYTKYKEVGEAISMQEPFAQMGSANQFIVEMLVDEVDIARLSLGQQVMISLDAYPEDIFQGILTRILSK